MKMVKLADWFTRRINDDANWFTKNVWSHECLKANSNSPISYKNSVIISLTDPVPSRTSFKPKKSEH